MHQHLHLGYGIIIPVYNLMIGVGVIVGLLFLEKQIKNRDIDFTSDRNIHIALIVSILLGVLGSKLFEILYTQPVFSFEFLRVSGLTFYGGLIFGVLGFLLVNIVLKTNNSMAFNLVIPSLILAHSFGRIGCFFAGCCFGKPTDSFIGVTFPEGSMPFDHYGQSITILPVQLFEALFLLSFFFVMIKLIKFELRTSVYFMGYGLFRFFIEYLRNDYRGEFVVSFLSPSQVISVILFLFGAVIFLFVSRKSLTGINCPAIRVSAQETLPAQEIQRCA